jgi:hypothetical protein
MSKIYVVRLEAAEREQLQGLVSKGRGAARHLRRARILLQADASPGGMGWIDQQIADGLGVSVRHVEMVRKRFVLEGLEACLKDRPREPRMDYKIDGEKEARLIALSCSEPPDGRRRWTLRLLASKLVELKVVDTVSHETIRRAFKKTS